MRKSHLLLLVASVAVVITLAANYYMNLFSREPAGNDDAGLSLTGDSIVEEIDASSLSPPARIPDPFVQNMPVETAEQSVMRAENLTAEVVASGFSLPTSMAFIDDNSVIVLEKNSGLVYLVSLEEEPTAMKKELLRLDVANGAEQGLLGIAVADMSGVESPVSSDEASASPPTSPSSPSPFVFLYFTEIDENERLVGNSVYRYEWDAVNEALVNPVLIVSLPADPGPTHNSGKLVVSNEGHLYVVIGDLNRTGGPLQNQRHGEIDDSSVILRVDFDGNAIESNPFYGHENEMLDRYFAYGIRNSFGLAIDPVIGTLWATENGVDIFDEINIVYPGFNSGWQVVMGPVARSNIDPITEEPREFITPEDLVSLNGASSGYDDPVFSWFNAIGVTDIEFLDSDRLGAEYRHNIFVGDINAGVLYYFKVNESRTGLDLRDYPELSGGVAETYEEGYLARIGTFPGGITHLETGPDGFLYVLTFGGNIFRIMPAEPEVAISN